VGIISLGIDSLSSCLDWLKQFTPHCSVPYMYYVGLVRDASGQKMSKTKGNVIDPLDVVDQFGSDALRYSLVTGSTPGQDVPLSMERIESNR
jgi:valyl-tRNA synthetase